MAEVSRYLYIMTHSFSCTLRFIFKCMLNHRPADLPILVGIDAKHPVNQG
jgi:hypothetical protein